jgi:hypothetical protein
MALRQLSVLRLILILELPFGSEKFISDIAFSEKLNIGFNLIGR